MPNKLDEDYFSKLLIEFIFYYDNLLVDEKDCNFWKVKASGVYWRDEDFFLSFINDKYSCWANYNNYLRNLS